MTASDLHQVARQLERETQAQAEQRHRIKSRTRRAEERCYGSATIYGQKLIKTFVGQVGELMAERLHLLRRGTAGIDGATVYKHLQGADADRLALLTMKVCLDVLAKEHKPQLCDLTLAIGRSIEIDLRLEFYLSRDPDLYKRVESMFHGSTGTRQKATVFRLQFNRNGIEWDSWPNATIHKIGAWALNALIERTGWIHKETVVVGAKKTRTVMRFSQAFLGLKGAILAQAEELAFCQWPMVCEPIEWSNDEPGGYLTGSVRGNLPMVRKSGSKGTVKQGTVPITMLNNLQRVAYRINPEVLEVANWAYNTFQTIGKFRREDAKAPPPRPLEDASPEQIKAYKRSRREIEDYNAQLEQKNWRTTEVMYIANKFASEERLYYCWSFDYRGRLYPQATGLTIQGTDFDKALHLFAEEGPANEYWLAFACSTTAGLDKASMADRIAWTRDNKDRITAIATDPIGNVELWRDADEPWTHLASCLEYYACCIACTRATSGLPVGIDATASGIQHLSALTADVRGGALCNCTPSDRPVDAYKTVAECAIKYIDDESVHPYIDRQVAKRPTMVLPYSGTRESARGYIREALMEKKLDLSVPKRLSLITTAIYDKAIPEVFPGPVGVMNWFKQCARTVMATRDHMQWTSPSGFVIHQDLRKSLCTRVKTRIMGEVVKTTIGTSWGDPDVNHHVNALSPNVVHSIDSALIHLTFVNWTDRPFSVIHDCVLGRSCDMDDMAKEIRETFVEIYRQPVLERWATEVGVTVPPGLIQNTLDIELVNASPYFFC